MDEPVTVYQPATSIILLALLITAHAGTILCLLLSNTPTFPQIGLIIGIIGIFVFLLRQHILHRNALSILRFWAEPDKQWRIHTKSGHHYVATLNHNSIVTRYLLILHFKLEGKRFSSPVFITPLNLPLQQLKQLRSILIAL